MSLNENKPKALLTGITGQDGSYLAELLLSKGYEVHGIIRRASTFNTERIDNILVDVHNPKARLFLHFGDLSDLGQIINIIHNVKPDEIYHLGSQSHVRVSFDIPEYTGNITGLGTTRLLEAIKNIDKNIKFYQASSSEMFGASSPPQSETTEFRPRSPYACAKLYAYWLTKNYREAYNIFACNGILFNHESPRRGKTFVTRKITQAATNILAKKQDKLYLGNLDAKRDWGFAPEYVEFMWKMMQQEKPDDFVIGTGKTNSVKEFLDDVFSYIGLDSEKYVELDKRYLRNTEINVLKADIKKSEKKLGWKPKIDFKDLAKIMVDSDMRAAGLEVIGEGDKIVEKKFPNRWWKAD